MRIIPEENHQWGDPSPGQLLSVAISVILIWAILTGSVDAQHPSHLIPIAGLWFLCTAIYSFMSGLVQLRNGMSFTGTLQTFFGIFFFAGFGVTFLVGFFNPEILTLANAALFPFAFVVLATILAAFSAVVILMERVVGISLIFFVIGLYIQGIGIFMGMSPEKSGFIGGWFIGIAGFILLYAGIAEVINEPLGKEVLPLP